MSERVPPTGAFGDDLLRNTFGHARVDMTRRQSSYVNNTSTGDAVGASQSFTSGSGGGADKDGATGTLDNTPRQRPSTATGVRSRAGSPAARGQHGATRASHHRHSLAVRSTRTPPPPTQTVASVLSAPRSRYLQQRSHSEHMAQDLESLATAVDNNARWKQSADGTPRSSSERGAGRLGIRMGSAPTGKSSDGSAGDDATSAGGAHTGDHTEQPYADHSSNDTHTVERAHTTHHTSPARTGSRVTNAHSLDAATVLAPERSTHPAASPAAPAARTRWDRLGTRGARLQQGQRPGTEHRTRLVRQSTRRTLTLHEQLESASKIQPDMPLRQQPRTSGASTSVVTPRGSGRARRNSVVESMSLLSLASSFDDGDPTHNFHDHDVITTQQQWFHTVHRPLVLPLVLHRTSARLQQEHASHDPARASDVTGSIAVVSTIATSNPSELDGRAQVRLSVPQSYAARRQGRQAGPEGDTGGDKGHAAVPGTPYSFCPQTHSSPDSSGESSPAPPHTTVDNVVSAARADVLTNRATPPAPQASPRRAPAVLPIPSWVLHNADGDVAVDGGDGDAAIGEASSAPARNADVGDGDEFLCNGVDVHDCSPAWVDTSLFRPMRTILRHMFAQTAECLWSSRFELRRIASMVLPLLTEVLVVLGCTAVLHCTVSESSKEWC